VHIWYAKSRFISQLPSLYSKMFIAQCFVPQTWLVCGSLTNTDSYTWSCYAACQNVRNRNLSILGRSPLRVKALFIGQACVSTYGKPRITNSVCAFLMEREWTGDGLCSSQSYGVREPGIVS
jgi:hypothetical protein